MFKAAMNVISPKSQMDEVESYADTYFREIGFKTGEASVVGSTESPDLDRQNSAYEPDRSLGLLDDNSLATDVEQALTSRTPTNFYGQQRRETNNDIQLTMLQAYGAPFHSYFGKSPREDDSVVQAARSNNFNITTNSDDVSISTLGEESIRRKPSPLNAVPTTVANAKPISKRLNNEKVPQKAPDLQISRTASTLKARPSEDSGDFQKPPFSEVSVDPLAMARRWRFIYFIFGVSLILLAAAGAVLGISFMQLRSNGSNEGISEQFTDDAWMAQIPDEWKNIDRDDERNATDVPSDTGSIEASELDVLLKMEDILQLIASVSPGSLAAVSNISSPQYQAVYRLVHDPAYTTYSLQKIVQRWALGVFYYSLGGGGWTFPAIAQDENKDEESKNLWLSETDECSWQTTGEGLCDESGRIFEIHLSGISLSGSIPKEIFLLGDSLERIVLSSNNISGTIPKQLGDLNKLERLDLTHNQFEGQIPIELSKLSDLFAMSLGFNSLGGTIPKEVSDLSNLGMIGLESNALTGTIPTEFGLLKNLGVLTLESNQLEGDLPTELGLLENLQVFLFHQNNFSGSISNEFCKRDEFNKTSVLLSADCEEVQCECCAVCCIGCEGAGTGILIDRTETPAVTPTAMPANETAVCESIVTVSRPCVQTEVGRVDITFEVCDPLENAWIGLFHDDFSFWHPVGESAPPGNEAENWADVCENFDCSMSFVDGTISFRNDEPPLRDGQYRIFLVQNGVTMATSAPFQVNSRC